MMRNRLADALEKIIDIDTCVSDGGKVHDHGPCAEIAIAALAESPTPSEAFVAGGVREALELLLGAALLMPRATPNPGGASTVHTFNIEAAYVWALDECCKAAQRVLSTLPAPEPQRGTEG